MIEFTSSKKMFLAKAVCRRRNSSPSLLSFVPTTSLRRVFKILSQEQHINHTTNNFHEWALLNNTTTTRNFHSFSLQLYAKKKAEKTNKTTAQPSSSNLHQESNSSPEQTKTTTTITAEQNAKVAPSPVKEPKKQLTSTELRLLKQQETVALRKERLSDVVNKLFKPNHSPQQNKSCEEKQTQPSDSTTQTKKKRKTKKSEEKVVPPFVLQPYTNPEIDSIFSAILSISPKATINLFSKQEPEDEFITVLKSKRAKDQGNDLPQQQSSISQFSEKQVNFTQYTKVETSVLDTPLEMTDEELAAEAFPTSKMPNINDNDDSDILEYLKELKNRNSQHKTIKQQYEMGEMTASDEAWKQVLEKPESSHLEEDLSEPVVATTTPNSNTGPTQLKHHSPHKRGSARYDQDDVVLQFLKDLIK